MKTFTLTMEYSGEAESWEEIRENAENNKIKNVFIGTKEFVNVVRCKDCKWFDKTEPKQCRQHGICNIHDDFFCADGERKEQEDEE